MIARGKINDIDVTVGAINFDFIGGSVGAAEGEAIIYGVQHAIDNQTPYIFFPCGGGQRMFESQQVPKRRPSREWSERRRCEHPKKGLHQLSKKHFHKISKLYHFSRHIFKIDHLSLFT